MKCLLFICYFHFQISFAISQSYTDLQNIYTEIFDTNQYEKKIFPMSDYDHPILLDVSLYFLGINEINELEEKLVTTGYLTISWNDFRLTWDQDWHNNVLTIFVPQDDVWKPDIVLYNGFKRFQQLGGSFYNVEVWHDGIVTWMPFEVFESRCSLDTTYYPFDKQTCNIVFVIWSFTAGEVMIGRSFNGLVYDEEFQENNVWEIINTSYNVFMSSRESRITFEIQLRRKPLFYVISFIIPVLILGLLNSLVFVIPAESGEKTGYSVTIFLALAVFLSLITSVIPTNSETTSLLGIFLLLQVIIGSLVLLITSLQLRICQRGDRPVSGCYKTLARFHKGCQCRLRKKNRIDAEGSDYINKSKDSEAKENEYAWSDAVSGIDFICFWTYLFVYSAMAIVMFSLMLNTFF